MSVCRWLYRCCHVILTHFPVTVSMLPCYSYPFPGDCIDVTMLFLPISRWLYRCCHVILTHFPVTVSMLPCYSYPFPGDCIDVTMLFSPISRWLYRCFHVILTHFPVTVSMLNAALCHSTLYFLIIFMVYYYYHDFLLSSYPSKVFFCLVNTWHSDANNCLACSLLQYFSQEKISLLTSLLKVHNMLVDDGIIKSSCGLVIVILSLRISNDSIVQLKTQCDRGPSIPLRKSNLNKIYLFIYTQLRVEGQ